MNDKETKIVNGYQIRWNSFWLEWQVSRDGYPYCEFVELQDAIEHAENG